MRNPGIKTTTVAHHEETVRTRATEISTMYAAPPFSDSEDPSTTFATTNPNRTSVATVKGKKATTNASAASLRFDCCCLGCDVADSGTLLVLEVAYLASDWLFMLTGWIPHCRAPLKQNSKEHTPEGRISP